MVRPRQMRVALACACTFATAAAQQLPDEFARDGSIIPNPGSIGTLPMLHRNWTTRDGLPQDHVRSIVRTHDGFLWVATDAGLARFDGFEFKTYGLREGLGAVAVLTLLEARDGTLWVGTVGGGLSAIRDGKVVKTYNTADGLPSETIDTIGEDDQGYIWIIEGKGARLKDGRFELLPPLPFAGDQTPGTLFTANDGTLWVGFGGDKGAWSWSQGKWSQSPPKGPPQARKFCQDPKGRIWTVDAGNNLWCCEDEKWLSFPRAKGLTGDISSLAAGTDGTIWVSFYRSGFRAFRDGEYFTPITRGTPFGDLAEVVRVTPDGQLWLGSSTRGLFALTPAHLKVQLVENVQGSQSANFIGALGNLAPGTLLVGTQGRGFYLMAYSGSAPVESQTDPDHNSFVNSIIHRRNGEIWAGGGGASLAYRDGRMVSLPATFKAPAGVWDLYEAGDGTVWAGTSGGALHAINKIARRETELGNKGYPIKGITSQADGTIWVGTRGYGLFSKSGGKWPRYGKAEGLQSEVIRFLYTGPDDTLWVGTAGGGLSVKRGERFSTVTTAEGLPDDTISQIMEDGEGRLWLGTNRGLAILSKKEVSQLKQGDTSPVYPRVIDRFDGLLSEEFTIVPPTSMGNGQMAFATTQGVAMLKPEDFHADESTPPVLVEDVLLDGRQVLLKEGATEVPPGVMRIEFRYTGLYFAAPDRLRFRTRLLGLEENWGSASPDRDATYRNLAPGEYTFEVSASTGNGLWSPVPAVVRLIVQPNFWQTAWFRVLATVLVLGAVIVAVRQRERRKASRRIQQLERQQAVENERARIARDLHDDVGASLTQVALLSQLARSSLAKRPERAGKHVQEIFNTAKEVTRSLDEIVWAVNPANDTFESFALFLGAFVQNYSHTAGLRSRFDVPENLPALQLESSVRHHIYLATKEVMHNIAKHAKASEVRMTLTLEPGKFHLVIEDDGQGYDAAAPGVPDADGLINLQNRLKQIGGTCTRRSSPGHGTSVEMTVPLG
ncbi:sensor histidine kinase [Haloferula sp. BvORR071]|uniref:ligand-binding sensor domain-containing protein n=1 Tax=Haloferula sp. BvORR071 TaxID=1396141 RepID=UPI000550F942|nr:sensor histidine kinase [Haloferula sp. BvORR071]